MGLELAAGNDEGSAWPAFIRSLVERGLGGVRLVISDDHRGLVKAVREQLLGAAWQRCRVHCTRNAQDLVPRHARSMVASAIRSIFEQPDERSAREQSGRVIEGIRPRFPAVADLLADAEPDLLAHFTFPDTHRRQIRSTNPLERLNKEIKRRTAVVGIFLRVLLGLGGVRCAIVAEGSRVTRNLSVEPPGSDLVRASPLGPRGWPSDLIAA